MEKEGSVSRKDLDKGPENKKPAIEINLDDDSFEIV